MEAQAVQLIEDPELSMPPTELGPTPEQIASLAYALWQERGCPEGSPQADWLRAEQEPLPRLDG
jgi:hypothetical protein